jgi:hypothetical protein
MVKSPIPGSSKMLVERGRPALVIALTTMRLALVLLLLAVACVCEAWFESEKKDNIESRVETPVRFNCAAKYVDFNGGWVVDVVSSPQIIHRFRAAGL